MKNIFIKIAYIILFSIWFVGCGLPSYRAVNSPVTVEADVESQTVFKRFYAPGDDSGINGYEIYYKIYILNDPEISTDKNQFDEDNSDYIYEFGSDKPVKLGFHRLGVGTLTTEIFSTIPLIGSDTLTSGLALQIFIKTSDDEILINGSIDIGIPLRIVKEGSYYKSFSSNVLTIDTADNNGVNNGETYSVSFVAYSYASGIITGYQSSIPVFLGTITDIPNS